MTESRRDDRLATAASARRSGVDGADRGRSTPARPRGRSSAAWSAGRASWRAACPRCGPAATRAAAAAALAHRAGHAWEQLVLPVRARRLGAQALLCPANLAPLASALRSVVVIHDAAPLRHPGWYSRAYVAWQRLALPAVARRGGGWSRSPSFARAELARAARGRRRAWSPAGSTSASRPRPTRSRRGALIASSASVRALRRLPHGAQEPRRARPGGARAGRRRDRRRGRRRPPAAVRARAGARRAAAARPRRRRAAPRPVRRAPRRSPCRRSTRASGCPCWRRWRAARRSWPRTRALPETCGGAARAGRRPTARRSPPRCPGCSATRRERERLSGATGLDARRSASWDRDRAAVDALLSDHAGGDRPVVLPALQAARARTRWHRPPARSRTRRPRAIAAAPTSEQLALLVRQARCTSTRRTRSRRRAAASAVSPARSRRAWPRSSVAIPIGSLARPLAAGQEISVTHTGLRRSPKRRITRRAAST